MAYAEDEPEPEKKRRLMFFGTDLAQMPCFRNSFMYGIAAGTGTGIVYNLATSRNPYRLAFGVYSVVTIGYFVSCRYSHRKNDQNMKQIRHAMARRAYLEGTEKDQEWAAASLEKRTEVRNFRSDVKREEKDG